MGLYALEVASDFLQRALAHARTDEEGGAVQEEMAGAAEHSGRWADVERWCDGILASSTIAADETRALHVRLRRLQARVRLGQGAGDTAAECRALLVVAERVGALSNIVQARSLLVQILGRAGELEQATRIAEESLRIAEAEIGRAHV